VSYVEVEYQIRDRHACRLMRLARATHRYRWRKREQDSGLQAHLKELAGKRMGFGYRPADGDAEAGRNTGKDSQAEGVAI
jgi:hypothetical protein